jgi:hypothetical protein
VPQVSLVLRDLGVATPAASVMGIAFFLPHFGSPVVDVFLAQVSQLRRDLGHPAPTWATRHALIDCRYWASVACLHRHPLVVHSGGIR